jgi:hypothetical protein
MKNLLLALVFVATSFTFLSKADQVCEVRPLEIVDVTSQWTYDYRVISAFPRSYDRIRKEENASIIKVFRIFRSSSCGPSFEKRLEVFYTGGDWRAFGFTYFVTDASNPNNALPYETVGAYYLEDLSTADSEEGRAAPRFDPLDEESLKRFILEKFLDSEGKVRSEFRPLKRP